MDSEAIAGRFMFPLRRPIGKGAFCNVFKGVCYTGVDKVTGKDVAIKVSIDKEGQLLEEAKILGKHLKGIRKAYTDFPEVLWQGKHEGRETIVMEMLGPCLLDLFLDCNRHFSPKTIYMIAEQLLNALEALHGSHYLHRDLKPDNICIGTGPLANRLYLIDFGLSRKYARKGRNLPCDTGLPFQGNVYWSSSNVLKGLTGSRRDDLESLMYVLLYLSKGDLPWYVTKEQRCSPSTILDRRCSMTISEICHGAPAPLVQALSYAKSLTFAATPRYDYLKSLFRDAAAREEILYDFIFDWQLLYERTKKECCLDDINIVKSREETAKTQDWDKKLLKLDRNACRERSMSVKRKRGSNRSLHKEDSVNEKVSALNISSSRSPGSLMANCYSPRSPIDSSINKVVLSRPRAAHSTNDLYERPKHDRLGRKGTFVIDLHQVKIEDLRTSLDTDDESTPKSNNPISLDKFRQRYEEYKAKAAH